MDPLQSDLSHRFAKSCAAAAFGYARAASAAYAALADQTLDFWSNAARAGMKTEAPRTPRLQLVSGPQPFRSAYVPSAASAGPSLPLDFAGMVNAWAASPMLAPMRAWWGLFPLQGPPASWPMAYTMMSAGVPRAVALPAAEANLAAMDAADAAKASLDRAFSSYRTDGGFAATQVLSPKAWLDAFTPFTPPFKQS